ncbi:MAG: 4-oxalocrotonate tautomerase family enzyme [bacterium]|jgi:4-oxalocrotonate tautomerase family enzyme
MPTAIIEIHNTWNIEAKQKMIELLHQSMVNALKTPPQDKVIRVIEYSPENFAIPSQLKHYALIQISMFTGRTLETKRILYQEIVQQFKKVGFQPEEVRIVIHEVPPENWGIRGGQAACDVILGYSTKQ